MGKCIYIYIYIYGEMLDFSESDKMIKISGKVDKSNTYNGFTSHVSFFIQGRTSNSEELLHWIKNEILLVNSL